MELLSFLVGALLILWVLTAITDYINFIRCYKKMEQYNYASNGECWGEVRYRIDEWRYVSDECKNCPYYAKSCKEKDNE